MRCTPSPAPSDVRVAASRSGREVIRFNPLGINEGASPESQLWVLMAQIQQELELRNRADVLVTDRSVVDNFAYYLRVTDGADPFAVEPLIRRWSQTYDLFVRLLPDVALLPDGVRSTNDAFRDEIEAILDRILPTYMADERLISIPASRSPSHSTGGRSPNGWPTCAASHCRSEATSAIGLMI